MQLIKKLIVLIEIVMTLLIFFGCSVNFEIVNDAKNVEKLVLDSKEVTMQYHQKNPLRIRIKEIKPHSSNGIIKAYLKGDTNPVNFIKIGINASKRVVEITDIDPTFLVLQDTNHYQNSYNLEIKAATTSLCEFKLTFTENREILEQTTEQAVTILKTVRPTTQPLTEENLVNLDFDIKFITKTLYNYTKETIDEANRILTEDFSQCKADKVNTKLQTSISDIKKQTVSGKKKIVLTQPFANIVLGLFAVSVVVMLLSLFLTFNLKFKISKRRHK